MDRERERERVMRGRRRGGGRWSWRTSAFARCADVSARKAKGTHSQNSALQSPPLPCPRRPLTFQNFCRRLAAAGGRAGGGVTFSDPEISPCRRLGREGIAHNTAPERRGSLFHADPHERTKPNAASSDDAPSPRIAPQATDNDHAYLVWLCTQPQVTRAQHLLLRGMFFFARFVFGVARSPK